MEHDDGHMQDFERFGKITASLVSAILRCDGETKSRKWAWRCITGREPEREPGWDMQRGLEHEKDALNELEVELNLLAYPGRFVVHPTIHWLGASPDGFISENGVMIPIECKCPRVLHVDIPATYYAQVQTQLECCNSPYAYFVSWVENSSVQFVKRIERSAEWWAEAYPQLEDFYRDYVERDIEPPKSPRKTKEKV